MEETVVLSLSLLFHVEATQKNSTSVPKRLQVFKKRLSLAVSRVKLLLNDKGECEQERGERERQRERERERKKEERDGQEHESHRIECNLKRHVI